MILHNFRFDYKQSLTFLAHMQTGINDRPLTFTYEEPGEEVLTTQHLLYGHTINTESFNIPHVLNLDYSGINWINEQLQTTRQRNKIMKKNYEGDAVLVHDERKMRVRWNIVVVNKKKPLKDNNVSSAINIIQ